MEDKYSSKHELDKFYTKESVAKECLENLDLDSYDCVIEPSAGSGAFSNSIKHKNLIALDLKPEAPGIAAMDWFDYKHTCKGKTIVVGNPPFGKRNYLSKEFIKHAITFADTVAMILPNVYNKHTNQAIFPKGWRLVRVVDIGDNAFTLDGEEYHVPCSFYIFDKSPGDNLMFDASLYKDCKDFSYCKKEEADLFIMGAGCKVKEVSEVTTTNRGYYIKSNIEKHVLISRLNNTKWYGQSSANGGVWWLSKPELIKLYKEQHETTT